VAVLCLKGLEVSFKIPGGPGIYLQGVFLHQGIVDPQSNMFYVNIRELLAMSLHCQDPQRFNRVVSDVAPDSTCLAGKCGEGLTPDKIRQVLWLHKRLGHPSRGTMVKAIQNATWQGVP
jgi:hypothetical protein